jgi:hypothetical protein
MLQITNLKTYLLLKKLKGLICYLKNLKNQFVTNVKLKRHMNAFYLYLINIVLLLVRVQMVKYH